jgi:thermitase
MKRCMGSVVLILILLWSLASVSPLPLHSQADYDSHSVRHSTLSSGYVPGQILVKFHPWVPASDAARLLAAQDLTILGPVADLGVLKIAVSTGQEEAAVKMLATDPRVEYAELDYLAHAAIVPNDTHYSQQWGLARIDAPGAWDVLLDRGALEETGNITIAVLDTGVDLNHPDLDAKIVQGYDFANNDSVAQDDHGHGTHVAGIAAAETNNHKGVAGVSWGARIMPVKVLDENGSGPYSDVAQGILFACDHGAAIINMSLGGNEPSSTLQDAVEQAHADGCLMVAAAGNTGGYGLLYPARYPETMAVAATDEDDHRAGFSSYGAEVDVAAPGVSIFSTYWDDSYTYISGTSMSTPHVAGLAALIWSVDPELTNSEVESVIETAATDLGSPGWDPYYGFGRIDARRAVEDAVPPTLTVSHHSMLFLADATTEPLPQTLLVGNEAFHQDLTWDAVEMPDEPWLDLEPLAGQAAAGQHGEISVSVGKNGLEPGTYEAVIEVSSTTPDVVGSPQVVDVMFVYSPNPLHRSFLPLVSRN